MAADTITFPTFAELGRQAREIERGMLQVKPSQISGSLQSEEHFSLFPREFEDYTAAYLVSEAHKIERKIFASNYQAEIASAPAGQAQERASGPLPSDELHQFASEQPPQVQPGPAKGPSTPNIPKTAGFHLRDMLGKGGASAPPQAGQAPPCSFRNSCCSTGARAAGGHRRKTRARTRRAVFRGPARAAGACRSGAADGPFN